MILGHLVPEDLSFFVLRDIDAIFAISAYITFPNVNLIPQSCNGVLSTIIVVYKNIVVVG